MNSEDLLSEGTDANSDWELMIVSGGSEVRKHSDCGGKVVSRRVSDLKKSQKDSLFFELRRFITDTFF